MGTRRTSTRHPARLSRSWPQSIAAERNARSILDLRHGMGAFQQVTHGAGHPTKSVRCGAKYGSCSRKKQPCSQRWRGPISLSKSQTWPRFAIRRGDDPVPLLLLGLATPCNLSVCNARRRTAVSLVLSGLKTSGRRRLIRHEMLIRSLLSSVTISSRAEMAWAAFC